MKKIIFLCFFISFKILGQAPKMDVVVSTAENIDGIRAVMKNTAPSAFYSAVKGQNNSTNGFGYGVQGIHLGSGYGVHGQSVSGFAVAGFSSHVGVFGRGDLGGVLGQSISGKGVIGASSDGIGGHFESATGYALITGAGNVGIGIPTPTYPLDINGRIRLRNNGGYNTAGIWYDNDAGAQRVFVGMETNDLFGFYGTPGWSFRFNATNGNVGISTVPTANKLEVNGSIGSSSLAGTGYNQLYANSTGTIIATGPVAFSVYNPNVTATTIISGVSTVFNFNSELYDLGGFFNNTNYEFTAPLNAIYNFNAFVTFDGVTSISTTDPAYFLDFLKNNLSYFSIKEPMLIGGSKTLHLSQDVMLSAGEKVKISIAQTSGNSLSILGGKFSNFSVHLVTRL